MKEIKEIKEELRCKVESDLKKEFQNMVLKKHDGKKRNFYGREIGKAMKLYLSFEGIKKYRDDPDIQDLLSSFEKSSCTHTHQKRNNRNNDLGLISAGLKDHYKGRKEITRAEMESYIIKTQGVSDPRAIERITKGIISLGHVEPIGSKLFDIDPKKENF